MVETIFVTSPRPRWKKVLIALGVIVLGVFAFLTWYKLYYSMDVVEAFEVVVPNATHQVLIATQGSDFKNEVVSGVVEALRDRSLSINVIDVSALSSVNIDEWNAVVILHTWENWEPQADAKRFLERQANQDKVIVLTTSGAGGVKMDGIDAITSASKMIDVPTHVDEIVRRIEQAVATR